MIKHTQLVQLRCGKKKKTTCADSLPSHKKYPCFEQKLISMTWNTALTKKKNIISFWGRKKFWENTTISESVRDVQKENNGGTCTFKLEKGKYYGLVALFTHH